MENKITNYTLVLPDIQANKDGLQHLDTEDKIMKMGQHSYHRYTTTRSNSLKYTLVKVKEDKKIDKVLLNTHKGIRVCAAEVSGTQKVSGRLGEERNILSLSRFEPRTSSP